MNPVVVVVFILLYFGLLVLISHFTSRGADNTTFFIGAKQSPWYLVAFGMIGASLSGVTFISVPGWVSTSQFSYMQMVLGYFIGYAVVATVLMPLYYRLNLTSIYTYLEQRFGFYAYKVGAAFFILSRTVGAAFRLFLVANVLQLLVFDVWNIPFVVTVVITILLIWIYTYRGGIKTIVWTDSLQTLFMLVAVIITIFAIASEMGVGIKDLFIQVQEGPYAQLFFMDDWKQGNYFFKQLLSGAFLAIVMTGLDQDMMQKNLSCRNIKEAQKNMFSFSIVLIIVNFVFLFLGAALLLFAHQKGIEIPERTDDLYPMLATQHLPVYVGIIFVLGLVAAAYSSADSALTSLTTSVCIDFLNINDKEENQKIILRKRVHVIMSIVLCIVILIFNSISNESVISSLFKAAGYTYGPLLGLYAFGLLSKRKVNDQWIPYICVVSPIMCYVLNSYSQQLLNGYRFGFELLILNGLFTFLGIYILSLLKRQTV